MNTTIEPRTYSIIAGVSYLIIFFAAIFANFFVIESLLGDPLATVQQEHYYVRAGIMAFIITVVLDVVIAWALYELFKGNSLSGLSTLFRMMHAAIMGVAIFSLPSVLTSNTADQILEQVQTFNTTWLIGLFFFGIHLVLLANIIGKPKIITIFLAIAGVMYMLDTTAHFALPNYESYGDIFLMLVAIPSILGEMSFAIWLLAKGGSNNNGVGVSIANIALPNQPSPLQCTSEFKVEENFYMRS
ncbi:MAG: DUF4386 domain-containing protein [Gammaproteobacteria bacterium]|nr:DUF4386 domain-containing protein [Gammaproteobacteria bacterium]